jgi:hypothetical protein
MIYYSESVTYHSTVIDLFYQSMFKTMSTEQYLICSPWLVSILYSHLSLQNPWYS